MCRIPAGRFRSDISWPSRTQCKTLHGYNINRRISEITPGGVETGDRSLSVSLSGSRGLLHAVSFTLSPEQKYSPMHMLRKTSQGSIKKGYFINPKCPVSRLLGYLLFWQRHSIVYSFSSKNYYSSDIFLIDKLIPLLLVPMHFSRFQTKNDLLSTAMDGCTASHIHDMFSAQ